MVLQGLCCTLTCPCICPAHLVLLLNTWGHPRLCLCLCSIDGPNITFCLRPSSPLLSKRPEGTDPSRISFYTVGSCFILTQHCLCYLSIKQGPCHISHCVVLILPAAGTQWASYAAG
jgi:hypothetical protein